MRYLIDADWRIDATAGRQRAVQLVDSLLLAGAGTSNLAVCELYEGAFGTSDPAATLEYYRVFLTRTTLVPLTDDIAERFAALWSVLRRQGLLIADIDLLIAATAIKHDLVLVTRNMRHFSRIPGINLFREG